MIHDIEVREAVLRANRFETELARAKEKTVAAFDWYPYDTFGTLSILDSVLTGRHRWLRPLMGAEPVLDIGCGDGAMSFFFESLGARVRAIDHAPSNFNRMQGVKALKRALRSRVSVAEADLDARPDLALRECGLALFLGILYHLKNPLGVMEALASRARYCLLTTAITRYSVDQSTDVSAVPVAFLPGRDGLRGDETNFWIFSEAGLRNLVDRTGWDVCDWRVVEDEGSVLWGTQRDQRVACLLRSRVRPPVERSQLLAGWHQLENGAWRWTERRFSLWLAEAATVRMKLTVPPVVLCPLRLSTGDTFDKAGEYEVEVRAGGGPLEWEVDHALAPSAEDGRERGIVVRAIELS